MTPSLVPQCHRLIINETRQALQVVISFPSSVGSTGFCLSLILIRESREFICRTGKQFCNSAGNLLQWCHFMRQTPSNDNNKERKESDLIIRQKDGSCVCAYNPNRMILLDLPGIKNSVLLDHPTRRLLLRYYLGMICHSRSASRVREHYYYWMERFKRTLLPSHERFTLFNRAKKSLKRPVLRSPFQPVAVAKKARKANMPPAEEEKQPQNGRFNLASDLEKRNSPDRFFICQSKLLFLPYSDRQDTRMDDASLNPVKDIEPFTAGRG